ncbi:MAG: hypothetical protein OEZ01_00700 [Candidatus Heimdallarchaeota archaeon]|nr:hypothetical protein [Candidatus Heimdallarchaeota archaeon]MDH5644491.1 hypothetical protein [Candidatus Heimdallarchaeota archaeon]
MTNNCWACDEEIQDSDFECPSCKMPITKSNQKSELGDLLDGLIEEDSNKSEEKIDLTSVLEEEEFELPQLEEEDFDPNMPDMPIFDDSAFAFIPEEELKQEIELQKPVSRNVKLLKSFFTYVYWSLLFLLLGFYGFTIENPNTKINSIEFFDYQLSLQSFIFSWVSFLSMGWYFGFTDRKENIIPTYNNAIKRIFIQIIFYSTIIGVVLILLNPGFGQSTFTPKYYLITIYLLLSWNLYIFTFLSSGLILYLIGYKTLWSNIYGITSLSKVKPISE